MGNAKLGSLIGPQRHILKIIGEKAHFAPTVLLAFRLVPALVVAKLPLAFGWAHFPITFSVGPTMRPAFTNLLYLVGFPFRDTIQPILARYRNQKLRFLILALRSAQIYYRLGLTRFQFLCLVMTSVCGMVDRRRNHPGASIRAIAALSIVVIGRRDEGGSR